MRRYITGLSALSALALAHSPVWAQEDAAPAYVPDFLELDGSNGLTLIPDPEFSVVEGGTIEFWVEPDWNETPDFDPVVLSAAGQQGPSYVIAMLRDQDGVGVLSSEEEAVWAFDFSDGQVHHVAINFYEGEAAAIVDGQTLGLQPLSVADIAPSAVWVGTADGATAPFVGAIAALRIWGVPVEPEIIDTFRYRDVLSEADGNHPDIDYLQVVSDFDNLDVLTVQSEDVVGAEDTGVGQ